MIKTLKLSDKTVRRFKTHKNWKFSTFALDDTLILEQGDDRSLYLNSEQSLATEQQTDETEIKIKYGKKIEGTFFPTESKYYNPTKEPVNYDGSYSRMVYNSVKHLFYNDYYISTTGAEKNPLMVFGSETGKYTNQSYVSDLFGNNAAGVERRILGDEVVLLEVPSDIFGEKIKPTSLKITDYSSSYDKIEIVDDGATNLVVGKESFNDISEVWLGGVDEVSANPDSRGFSYADLTFGYKLSSDGKYFLTGCPTMVDGPSEVQSGVAHLYKHDSTTDTFRVVKNFMCPFTQGGLSAEIQNDNTGFLISELEDVLVSSEGSMNDNFGDSVELGWGFSAIGAPKSHIRGITNNYPTGHVFVYEKNKGGTDNWGLINIFEGEPKSEFGSSVSIYKNYMAVGSPGLNNSEGGVYIFKKTKRAKSHPWIRTSDVYDGYVWDETKERYIGVPEPEIVDEVREYKRQRELIVTQRIDAGEGKTGEDFSEKFPFRPLTHYVTKFEVSGFVNGSVNETSGTYWKLSETQNGKPIYTNGEWYQYWDGEYWMLTDTKTEPRQSNKSETVWDSTANEYVTTYNIEGGCTIDGDANWYLFELSPGRILDSSIVGANGIYRKTYDMENGRPTYSSEEGWYQYWNGSNWILTDTKYTTTHAKWTSGGSEPYPESFDGQAGCSAEFKEGGGDLITHGTPLKSQSERISYHRTSGWPGYVYDDAKKRYVEIPSVGVDKLQDNNRWAYRWKTESVVSSGGTLQSFAATTDTECDESVISTFGGDEIMTDGDYEGYPPHKYTESPDSALGDTTWELVGIVRLPNSERLGEVVKMTKDTLYSTNPSALNKKCCVFHRKVDECEGEIWESTHDITTDGIYGYSLEPDMSSDQFEYINMDVTGDKVNIEVCPKTNDYENWVYGIDDSLNLPSAEEGLVTSGGTVVAKCDSACVNPPEQYSFSNIPRYLDGKDCMTLPPNSGESVSVADVIPEDWLQNSAGATFYTKAADEPSYVNSDFPDDALAISWKNLRENVQFSYPYVERGTQPSFMTIYTANGKKEDGSYDPIHTLAEIGAQEALNGEVVRLTFNCGVSPPGLPTQVEFFYEFVFNGSTEGTHYTLDELETELTSTGEPIFRRKTQSIGVLPTNKGDSVSIAELISDDYLENKDNATFYTKSSSEASYIQPSTIDDSIALSWKNFREDVELSYPLVKRGTQPSFMTIYANGAKKDNGEYDPIYTLAEIGAQETLNGEVVRLTFNHESSTSTLPTFFYEFIFTGSVEGMHFTLDELETEVSLDKFTPIIVHTPLPYTCRHTIETEDLSPGKHSLYIGLVDSYGVLIGSQHRSDFYINPITYEYEPRHTEVKRKYEYDYDIPNKFGVSIDATEKYIAIGDSRDRSYYSQESPSNMYTAGATYVFSVTGGEIRFLTKLYGDSDRETEFDIRFGNSVSLLGDNLLVGGHCSDSNEIEILGKNNESNLRIGDNLIVKDYLYGADNIWDGDYIATEMLITDFAHSFDVDGNIIIKINISSLDIDLTKLSDVEVSADFINSGKGILEISGFDDSTMNGMYTLNALKKNNKPTFSKGNAWHIYYGEITETTSEAVYQYKWILTDTLTSEGIPRHGSDSRWTSASTATAVDLPEIFDGRFGHSDEFANQVGDRSPPNELGGEHGDVIRGIYRDLTKVVGEELWITAKLHPTHTEFLSNSLSVVTLIYYSRRNAIEGYAYYYKLSNESSEIDLLKKVKTNKEPYSVRKQFSHSVSMSSEFLYIGTPVLGDFNINEITSFGGFELTTFGGSAKIFSEYGDIDASKLKNHKMGIAGSVLTYDTASLRDGKQVYLGNVFYKNGMIALTDSSGYFSDVMRGSGASGFELEFKGTHTIYENEILCSVAPSEFNMSTNPTARVYGDILYDVNEDGRFDISDLVYIYKYLMGSLIPTDTEADEDEQPGAIVVNHDTGWPNDDVILSESEDIILMNLLTETVVDNSSDEYERVMEKLMELEAEGHLDIDGDGVSGPIDAKLLVRYFAGRTGIELIKNLVSRYGNATRTNVADIKAFLDEKTGKLRGLQLLDEFANYKENDAVDKGGSYLAPYVTTIGLYSGLELVMVAKLGKPVKILPNYPINFLVKFDT